MQQAGVIGILTVLVVELPVGRDALAGVAQHAYRADEQSVEIVAHRRIEKNRKWLDAIIERAEDNARVAVHSEHSQPMIGHGEVGRHATLAFQPT